ncbi:MAG: hypothetical protein IJD02_01885 [Lachnospiraceae bacterium]|nr:hypothetical protein [Lachnospiraceae bacterium]
MKKIVNVIVENDGYLIKNNRDDGSFTRVMPQGIQRIPCIPFYHSAWLVMGSILKPAVTDFVDVINSQYGKIKSLSGMIAYPADALPADVRMIEQTLEYAGFKELKLVSKTSLLKVEGHSNYIAISASERLVVLEWYRDGIPTESRYYNKMSVGRKRLLSDIEKIQKRQTGSDLKVYVFDGCSELAGLYNVGELVDENRALKLLVKTGYEQYKIKKIPQVNWNEDKLPVVPDVKENPALEDKNEHKIESALPDAQEENGATDSGMGEDVAVVCVPETLAKKDINDSEDTSLEDDKELEARLAMDINKVEDDFDEWAYKQAIGEEE